MRYDHTDECASNHGCESCKGSGEVQCNDCNGHGWRYADWLAMTGGCECSCRNGMAECQDCDGSGQQKCDCAPPEPDYEAMRDDAAYEREHRYDGPRLDFWQNAGGGKF